MKYDLTFVDAIISVLTVVAIVLTDVHGEGLAEALVGDLVSFVLHRFMLVKDYIRGFFPHYCIQFLS